MKRIWVAPGVAAVLFLGGCLPSFAPEKDEVIQENEEKAQETVIIPDVQLKDEFYRTFVPFKQSASRGMVVSNLHTKYDMKEAEEGLLRLSARHFDTDKYFFQEGQYIDKETAGKWLARKSDNEDGLNPAGAPKGASAEEVAEQAPIYLAHIVEQNYLQKAGENKVRLSGISIGLALNSIYYSRDGTETRIPDDKLQKEGMKMADEIVSRLRAKEGLSDIPIVIGLFKQESRSSIVPGTYFATAYADKGKTAASGWKEVNEKYVTLPAPSSLTNYRDINTNFSNFKQDIDKYFPSFVNVIGTAHFRDDQYQSLRIEVPIQFFGTSETIGFTQYMTSLVNTYFANLNVEVSITSVNGPEALIVKDAGEEPFVHIYGY
ncbi:putative lipoprotein YerH [Sporosarcina sp. NCCP-2222]|uniref:CamS family sex pheromone protein n=1 Tax=Sporosarcina sp. NCCP-2222 TaxID=2935073 RepID=UPI0020861DD1|nr:CamS family sex pheromone protein [Sporosarcina sp. NCCP-2222]GKV57291.1 putative lipoprotein YerH [Sporosarcina sp. NCCP-2222]